MSELTEKLLSVVRALPEADQREFAAALNGALMPDDEDPELKAELDRRWQAYQSGEQPGIPAEEVYREVRARYDLSPEGGR
jgi:putative addiction module component (TIGR02574 family)